MKKLIIVILIISTMMLTACDAGLEIASISIRKYPDKIAYFLSKDSELILDGLEILVVSKDGTSSVELMEDEDVKKLYRINHHIDFNKIGVYTVTIERHKSECQFAIEVIDLKSVMEN